MILSAPGYFFLHLNGRQKVNKIQVTYIFLLHCVKKLGHADNGLKIFVTPDGAISIG